MSITYRKFQSEKLLVASNNLDKAKELSELLAGYNTNIQILTLEKYNLESPEEYETSFIGNAKIKASYYSKLTGLPVVADDSGLKIDRLGGEPGVYSARWAGEERNFDVAIDKVESELAKLGFDSSRASFWCALVLEWPDGHSHSFEASIDGMVNFPRKGKTGFGYDPIFTPDGYDQTFAELGKDVKNKISHRAKALKAMIEHCFR